MIFVEFAQIRAENRPKSKGKIWKRTKNVVPLQSIREMLCEFGLRLSTARASSALRSPCTTLALSIRRQARSHYERHEKRDDGHPM